MHAAPIWKLKRGTAAVCIFSAQHVSRIYARPTPRRIRGCASVRPRPKPATWGFTRDPGEKSVPLAPFGTFSMRCQSVLKHTLTRIFDSRVTIPVPHLYTPHAYANWNGTLRQFAYIPASTFHASMHAPRICKLKRGTATVCIFSGQHVSRVYTRRTHMETERGHCGSLHMFRPARFTRLCTPHAYAN